jgi:hypothetical protein
VGEVKRKKGEKYFVSLSDALAKQIKNIQYSTLNTQFSRRGLPSLKGRNIIAMAVRAIVAVYVFIEH